MAAARHPAAHTIVPRDLARISADLPLPPSKRTSTPACRSRLDACAELTMYMPSVMIAAWDSASSQVAVTESGTLPAIEIADAGAPTMAGCSGVPTNTAPICSDAAATGRTTSISRIASRHNVVVSRRYCNTPRVTIVMISMPPHPAMRTAFIASICMYIRRQSSQLTVGEAEAAS